MFNKKIDNKGIEIVYCDSCHLAVDPEFIACVKKDFFGNFLIENYCPKCKPPYDYTRIDSISGRIKYYKKEIEVTEDGKIVK